MNIGQIIGMVGSVVLLSGFILGVIRLVRGHGTLSAGYSKLQRGEKNIKYAKFLPFLSPVAGGIFWYKKNRQLQAGWCRYKQGQGEWEKGRLIVIGIGVAMIAVMSFTLITFFRN